MRVSQEVMERNSEDDLAKGLHALSDAGSAVIHVRTGEPLRCLKALRLAILVDESEYNEWDVIHGWRKFDIRNRQSPDVQGDNKANIQEAIRTPESVRQDAARAAGTSTGTGSTEADTIQYFVFVNPQFWMENNPIMTHMLLHYSRELPTTNIRIVLVTPDQPLPEALADSVSTLRMAPPGHAELREALEGILSDLNVSIKLKESDKDMICFAGSGMTREAFEMYTALAIVEATTPTSSGKAKVKAEDILKGVNKGKTEVVNKSELLELYTPERIEDVGGLDLLKDWVQKRRNCFTEDAAEFGIESPKGIVFIGPPGTGKSLTAKAVSSVLGVPLIRLDFGRVFNSLVGSSEQRIRTALQQVSYMAPCVLFIDEIDKGLGGIGGSSGDSGTSSRVLGTFLTWLNDNKAPVFTMVTANNINGLPPELMRRGRFDDIFYASFPDTVDRREILDIHLRKRGYELDSFEDSDIVKVIGETNGFSGAEIESAVKDGLVEAFSEGCTRETFHLGYVFNAVEKTIALSKSYKEQIQVMEVWAKQHARAASIDRKEEEQRKDTTAARGRIKNRRRRSKNEVVH